MPHTVAETDRRVPCIGIALVPGLALLVASVQVALVHVTGLSPWKGGGFGMFSTIDAPDTRFVTARVTIEDTEFPAVLDGPFHSRRTDWKRQPLLGESSRILDALKQQPWERGEPGAGTGDMVRPQRSGSPLTATKGEVTVWGVTYSPDRSEIIPLLKRHHGPQ